MKHIEAMKLALDHSEPSILSPGWTLVRNEDIAALREALAEQPAQQQQQQQACPTCGEYEPRTGTCGTSPNDKRALCNRNAPQPAQQEPDAIGCKCSECGAWQRWTPSGMVCKNGHGGVPGVNHRLYTSSPAQRPWVGLTWQDWNGVAYTSDFRRGAEWADAQLREKNT